MGHVLVVDDNQMLCRAVMTMIRLMGAQAECVLGGEAALRYVAAHAVDLVILDYMMPDLDGLGVLRRLRADPRTRDLKVLMFTAMLDDQVRDEAQALGVSGMLEKSRVDFHTLQPWIEPLIDPAAAPAAPPTPRRR